MSERIYYCFRFFRTDTFLCDGFIFYSAFSCMHSTTFQLYSCSHQTVSRSSTTSCQSNSTFSLRRISWPWTVASLILEFGKERNRTMVAIGLRQACWRKSEVLAYWLGKPANVERYVRGFLAYTRGGPAGRSITTSTSRSGRLSVSSSWYDSLYVELKTFRGCYRY